MIKIGILTFHNVINYGGVLQCYALQQFLEKNGYDVEIIDYESKHIKKANRLIKFNSLKDFVKSIILFPLNLFRYLNYRKFILNYLMLSKKINNYYDLKKFCEENFEYVIVGSDQVWNSELTGKEKDIYFLKNIGVKKISYAASTGDDKIEDINRIIKSSSKFVSISVREASTQKKLIDKKINASLNVDPTLLIDYCDWDKLTGNKPKDKYLLLYILNKDKRIKDYSSIICEKQKIKKIYTFSKQKFGIERIKSISTAGPLEFIDFFKNASFILTNSFHGTIFSIIFRREFLVILPQKRQERLISLLKMLHISDRIISNKKELLNVLNTKINYQIVNSILEEERTKSKEYFINNIRGN